jgi:hypothetical protein
LNQALFFQNAQQAMVRAFAISWNFYNVKLQNVHRLIAELKKWIVTKDNEISSSKQAIMAQNYHSRRWRTNGSP